MKFFFFFILFGLAYIARAQQNVIPDRNKIDFSRFRPHMVNLAEVKTELNRSIPFKPANIIVLDYRFDSSSLGFINKKSGQKKKLVLKNGTCVGIEHFFKKILQVQDPQSTSGVELVAVLQKLWLSDDLIVTDKNIKRIAPMRSGMILQIGYFLKSGESYFPLYKFDTTIADIHPVKSKAGEYLVNALGKSIEKLRSIDVNNVIESGKGYRLADIENVYSSRFTLPVLLQDPKKGVYLSFEEFRKNQPSITEFSLRSDAKTDNIYYKDESGKEVLLRKLFAISDGKDFYIWSSDNLYRLYRSCNTFNLFGSRYFYFPSTSYFIDPLFIPNYLLAGAAGMSTIVYFNPNAGGNSKIKRKMQFYQLDMETGTFN